MRNEEQFAIHDDKQNLGPKQLCPRVLSLAHWTHLACLGVGVGEAVLAHAEARPGQRLELEHGLVHQLRLGDKTKGQKWESESR